MIPAGLLQDFSALHFLRPGWLYAFLLLPLLVWWWRARQREHTAWRGLVDPHLLPHLLETQGGRRARWGLWFAGLAYGLAVLALAGPSWRQSPQPLWQSRTPLVIALDLSSASLAADLPPSRLAQARAKLATLLRERNDGQVGLIAFAGDAFTVAPLTDDAANVALFLDALQPDVMPRDGQRPSEAITRSVQLLQRAGATHGHIVLLTDHADAPAVSAAAEAAGAGYDVSALGLGTEAGAAYRRGSGDIAEAHLDTASLRRLAASGNGRYAPLADDDADLRALGVLDPGNADTIGKGAAGLAWRDEGYWLLPPLLLLALLAFRRRGGALAVLVVCVALPPGKTQAADVWRRPDQVEYAQMQRGNQAYRKGDYQTAARQYQTIDNAVAHYNRGNALAKAGQYPQALQAYDQALRRQPGMADAIANRRAVEAAMKRQQQSGSKQGQPQKSRGGQGSGQSGSQSSSMKPDQPPNADAQAQSQNPQQQAAQQPTAQQQPKPSPAKPGDAQAQREADRAQRERMQRALRQVQGQVGKPPSSVKARVEETPEQRERRLANEAWLKRVPDDPGGLLRAKFRLEYERRVSQGRAEQ